MDDEANLPPPGPKQLPPRTSGRAETPPTGSTATNGHWVHDAAGPAVMVGGNSASMSRLESIISEKFPGLRCTIKEKDICIEGMVDTQAQADEIRQLVEELEPGMRVVPHLAQRGREKDG